MATDAHLSTMYASQNLTSEWNQKEQCLVRHASIWLLFVRFVAVAFRSAEEVLVEEGDPVTFACASLDPPRADMAETS